MEKAVNVTGRNPFVNQVNVDLRLRPCIPRHFVRGRNPFVNQVNVDPPYGDG